MALNAANEKANRKKYIGLSKPTLKQTTAIDETME